MSNKVLVSPNNAINKTRNAILRMKNCSPKLRDVLRQRCQERIQNDRLKILNTLRKVNIQDSFKIAFGNILSEEWKNIEDDELCEPLPEDTSKACIPPEINLEEELLLEELLEKELISEHEDWLVEQYEELLNEEFYNSDDVVCPLCCLGYLEVKDCVDYKRTFCNKCSSNFIIEKSLLDLQSAIYECLGRHDQQCDNSPGFVNIPKSEYENENNLCIICHQCSLLAVIV